MCPTDSRRTPNDSSSRLVSNSGFLLSGSTELHSFWVDGDARALPQEDACV